MKRYANSYKFWQKANSLILNGVSTLSKSPIYISQRACPVYVEKAKGAYFWDCDGNRYIDYPMALGPIILGYAFEDVDTAVIKQMKKGFLYSLSSTLELELAELLREIIPSAEMVKFLKTGSEATSAAVRVARAFTGREKMAVCGYHGWHDWTVGRTFRNAGVPESAIKLVFEFKYNDLDSLQRIFENHPGDIAAVILEPVAMYAPENGFLESVASLAKKNGALLIFDEIITGFRLSLGGAQSYFSVTPDLSAFGKAMANGYPISALVGKKEIMDAVQDKVFLSSTFGGDLLGITAAIKTINILKEKKVNEHILTLGKQLKDGINEAIKNNRMEAICEGMHHKTFLLFRDMEGVPAKMIEAIFRQECLSRGAFLGYGHFISLSHTTEDIQRSTDLATEVFAIIREALDRGQISNLLKGDLPQDVFKRY